MENAKETKSTTTTAAAPVVQERSWIGKAFDEMEAHPVCTIGGVLIASCLICWAAGGYAANNAD